MNLIKQFLGRQDVISIGKGLLIAEIGSLLSTALIWLQSGKLDFHVLLLMEITVIGSTFVNFIRKLIDGKVE